MPFSALVLDKLAALRIRAAPLSELIDELRVPASQQALFRSFFRETPVSRRSPDYTGDAVRVRYLGHACLLVQTADVAILVDPITAWEPHEDGRFTFHDLPDHIDYLVFTHAHQDHFSLEMLIQLRHRVGCVLVPRANNGSICDPSCARMLRHLGFGDVRELDVCDSIEVPDGRITSMPFLGEHAGLDIASKQCAWLEVRGRSILVMADADCLDPALYARLAAMLPRTDATFIGMECRGAPLSWIYGPLLAKATSRRDDESRRLSGSDCARAWQIIQHIPCTRLFVYAMGLEPWLRFLLGLEYTADSVQMVESDRLVQACLGAGIAAERLEGCREIFL